MDTPHPTRILLANFAGILGEMLMETLSREADLRLVGTASGSIEVLSAAQRGVDITILGVDQLYPPPGLCSQLLTEFPGMKVLVYSPNQNTATGYWLGVRRCNVRQINSVQLLNGIRNLSLISSGL